MSSMSPSAISLLAIVICFGAADFSVASSSRIDQAQAGSLSLDAWSEAVWVAARDGQDQRLAALLQAVPASQGGGEDERVRANIERRANHVASRSSSNLAHSEKLRAEVIEEFAKPDIAKGAVKLHELKLVLPPESWREVLLSEAMSGYETRIEAALNEAEALGDLLLTQELAFRLRAMSEDCGRPDELRKWDGRFDELSRRIALVALFAPRELHRMRTENLKRLAVKEEKLPEFDESFAKEWPEAMRGINQSMLSSAMRHLASEHVTGTGWKPLMSGGLRALRLLVSTPSLKESFPQLGSPEKVAKMTELIDKRLVEIENRSEREFGTGYFRSVTTDLLSTNRATVGVPEEVMLYQFGEGASEGLSEGFGDEYTEIIWPDKVRRFRQQIEGDFVGVGILIRHTDSHEILIVNPLEGSPASRGGIRPGDQITGVDGRSTLGWSLNKAVESITGPQGREVTLSIKRKGTNDTSATLDVPLVREKIKLRSVNGWWKDHLDVEGLPVWDWFIDDDSGIGYIRLTSFSDDSYDDFVAAIAQMRSERTLNGLILDLRGNPGGLLKSAVGFTNLFVQSGPIVSVEDFDGKLVSRSDAEAQKAPLANLPLVVLVNQGSASASEILSGSLQAHDAAVVLGERSFGKGSVQTVQTIAAGGHEAGVKVTTQYYRLPAADGSIKGRLVHKKPGSADWGVNPDLMVDMTPEQTEDVNDLRLSADSILEGDANGISVDLRPDVEQLVEGGLDPQLEMALILLQARTLKDVEAQKVAQGIKAGSPHSNGG